MINLLMNASVVTIPFLRVFYMTIDIACKPASYGTYDMSDHRDGDYNISHYAR